MEKIIEGYPTYAVTSDGMVRDLRTGTLRNGHNHYGYRAINLTNPDGIKQFLIHRLVAMAFLPNPDNLPEIDHINRIEDDNRVENLRWANDYQQCDNKGIAKNNTTGHKYITREKEGYRVQIKRNKVKLANRRFQVLEEAIAYKMQVCTANQIAY